jgi:sporulation protein YlmC with PRC-barrel domain
MTEGQLVGTRVVSQDGFVLGDVAGLVIDTDSWRIAEIAVRLRRESLEPLRLKKKKIGSKTVHLPAEEVSGVSDAVVLKHRRDQLTLVTPQGSRSVASQPESEVTVGDLPPVVERERMMDVEDRAARPPPPTRGGASPSSPR